MWSTLLCRGERMRKDKMAGGDKNGAEARSSSLNLSSQRRDLCQFCGESDVGPPWYLLGMTCGSWNQGHVLGKAWVNQHAFLKLFSGFTY